MDTAIRPTLSEPAFHADDVEEVAGYRSLSVLAIIGLVLGLASLLCLASRLFIVVPLMGFAVSLVALRRIAANESMLAGRWAAAAGLALCVASAVAAFSRDAVTRHLRSAQAEEFGRHWIGLLVAGRTEQAFRLTVAAARPAPPPEPGAPAPQSNPYDEFRKHPLVEALAAAGADATIEFQGNVEYLSQARRELVIRQQYLVTPSAAEVAARPGLRPVEAILALQRSQLRSEQQSRWLVAAYELPSASAGAEHDHTEH